MRIANIHSARRLWPALVALAMLSGATANLLQFAQIDAGTAPHHKALHEFETFDIVTLGLRQQNIHNTTNLFSVIRKEAPGARLIVTTPDLKHLRRFELEFRARMMSIGLSAQIEICELGPESLQQIIRPTNVLASGTVWKYPTGPRGTRPGFTWAVGEMSAQPELLLLHKTSTVDVLILDNELLKVDLSRCK